MSHRLERGAWLTLGITVLMLAWAAAGTLFYFSLPTDGWLTSDPPAGNPIGLVYTQNAADLHLICSPATRQSPLQASILIREINGPVK